MATVAELVDVDGLIDLQCAVFRQAVEDYRNGPGEGHGRDAERAKVQRALNAHESRRRRPGPLSDVQAKANTRRLVRETF